MQDVHIFLPTAVILGTLCFLLTVCKRRSTTAEQFPDGFLKHQRRYLIAWTLGITGEWLCGPGVYALYASYGFTHEQTGQLFVLGFVFSSILGCFAGNFADRFGRKKSAMIYCFAGVTGCMLKHVPWIPALFVARLLDGLHASLLYTAFESWLVGEHLHHHDFPPDLLGHTFGLMYRFSYFSAIFCGLVAQYGVDSVPMFDVGGVHFGRWGVPLEMSAAFQLICGLYIAFNWDENYGGGGKNADSDNGSAKGAVMKALKQPQVLVCGIMVACFESSLFIFVFSWTPSLAPNGDKSTLPCGMIFAVYMMACMCGASVYSWLSDGIAKDVRPTRKVFAIVVLATASMLGPSIWTVKQDTVAWNFLAFVAFEFCVGAYFPSAGAMKSELVEETHRTTIYNVFRTPMNLIVVGVVLCAPSETTVWRLIFGMMLLTAVALGGFCMWERRLPRSISREPLLRSQTSTPTGGTTS